MRRNWYFLQEIKSAVTTRRSNATLCIKLMAKEVIRFSVPQCFRHSKYPSKNQSTKLIQTLLLIRGNVKLNPGPTNIKYSCGDGARAVKFETSIASHQEYAGMNSTTFERHTNAAI